MQTEAQLKKDNENNQQHANKTHFEVGKRVHNTMVNKPKEQKKLEKQKTRLKS